MEDIYKKRKEDYLVEYGYYDKVYIDEKEEKYIKNIGDKSREKYIEENKLQKDKAVISDYGAEYFRIIYWDIKDDELERIVNMNISTATKNINFKLNIILGIIIFMLVVFII